MTYPFRMKISDPFNLPEFMLSHFNRVDFGGSALDAVRHVHKLINTGHGEIVDADLSSYLDPASYCPQTHEVVAKSMG